jgi:alpha-L-fucosidase 2
MRPLLISALVLAQLHAVPLEIRFDRPPQSATGESGFPDSNWESQAQPVGNGRLGAMVFGNPLKEHIQFNDISLWTGGNNPSGGYEVEEFGSYQNFGNLYLEMKADGEMTEFSRSLDLSTGIHTTTWKQGGVSYKREVFASKPDDAIVIRIQTDPPGKISGVLQLTGAHQETTAARDGTLTFSGTLANGLRKAAQLKVICEKVETVSDQLSFTGDSATLILAAATDYALDPANNFRSGLDPAQTVAAQVASASAKSYAGLRQAHLADFQKLMGRVDLDIGPPPADPSISSRLAAYKNGAEDPHLEMLMFQYGRYLLISSSRDLLPANLQGLWNNQNKPAWFADYHTNINLQMNYWLAEPANLSECAKPLFHWTTAMIPGSREATVKAFGEKTPGWTMRTSVNIYGGNGWQWNLPASAWLAQHFWEHYAFTGDRKFLAETAWPVFSDVCAYWLDHLVEKDGKLVVPKGWSPEHGPREDGVAHDQQIVWDLFTNTLEAAKVLGKSDPLIEKIAAARENLLGPQIGSWGQIMEWTSERPELEKSGHRHTSHLFALHPGRQFTLHGTPDFAKAAAVSLEARGTSGDSRRSWTWAWRTAMWGRLGRPEKAAEMIRGLLTHNTLANLFTSHPPFQIDGNLGITAGICEMLVQSHAGEISILPAISPKWQNGSVRGLKARGGFEISAVWKDGKPSSAEVFSQLGNPAVVRLPGDPKEISLKEKDGPSAKIPADPDGLFRFPTKKGMTYQITGT